MILFMIDVERLPDPVPDSTTLNPGLSYSLKMTCEISGVNKI